MGYVRSRKFCCCLPVRFGVFIMSIFGIVAGGAIAGYAWVQVVHFKEHPTYSRQARFALIANTIVWTLICITSIFGLLGTIMKRRGFVSTYSTMLFSLFGFNLVAGIIYLHTLFQKDTVKRNEADCIGDSTETLKIDACKASYALGRGITIVVYIVGWLVMIYACTVVADYVGQLSEEEEVDAAKIAPFQTIASISAPSTTYGQYQQPVQSQYPYTNQQNSFGNGNNNSMV